MCFNIFHSANADSWFGAERADERSDCARRRRQGEQYSNGTTVLPTQFNFESWVLWQLFNFILDIFQELLPRPSNNTTCAASEEERRLDSEIWWRASAPLDSNHGHIMWSRNGELWNSDIHWDFSLQPRSCITSSRWISHSKKIAENEFLQLYNPIYSM